MKITTIIGARPQFIKAAIVSASFNDESAIDERIVHTGQHYDRNMSQVFFEELGIPPPDVNLAIGGGTHGQNTGRMIEAIEADLTRHYPDCVLVYGDTDSTLAGAIAAAKLNIPIAHVEAGLRSGNRKMPEEINRVLVDHLSTHLFAPTNQAVKNLMAEGIHGAAVTNIGDVMYDAALHYSRFARAPKWFREFEHFTGEFVLCTVHRPENTNNRSRMMALLRTLGQSGVPIIFPLHPRTKDKISEFEIPIPANVFLVEPVSYLEMVWLEVNCRLVATDSGGVQKEAYFHSKPCLILRNETEWTEIVDIGAARLVDVEPDLIISGLRDNWGPVGVTDCFGSGKASQYLLHALTRT